MMAISMESMARRPVLPVQFNEASKTVELKAFLHRPHHRHTASSPANLVIMLGGASCEPSHFSGE